MADLAASYLRARVTTLAEKDAAKVQTAKDAKAKLLAKGKAKGRKSN
jgi:hypothetical protein